MKYHHYAELIAALTGVFLFRKQWPYHYKLIVGLLLVTFIVEGAAQYLWNWYHYNNNWMYNLFLPVQCFIFLYFFYSVLSSDVLKKVQVGVFTVGILGVLVSYWKHPFFFSLNSYASTLYLFLLLVSTGLFFVDTVSNDNSTNLRHQPPFWLASGLLFFSVIFIVRFIFWEHLKTIPNYKLLLDVTNKTANTLMYGGIIFCFLCLYKTKNYSMPL